MDSYYFTFGTDERYPYQGGYVEIEAECMKEAQAIFRAHYPDRTPGILNCADYYTRHQMERTGMLETGNRGAGCHRLIHAWEPLPAGKKIPGMTVTVDGKVLNARPTSWAVAFRILQEHAHFHPFFTAYVTAPSGETRAYTAYLHTVRRSVAPC